MNGFSISQRNNLIVGTHLAAELSSSLELRSFIVIGSYVPKTGGRSKPSSILNRDYRDLRFWIRKYEINKSYIGSDEDISVEQCAENIFRTDIENIKQLENEVEKYLQDFSLLKTVWTFDPPLPFC